jgi:hypothetical protein
MLAGLAGLGSALIGLAGCETTDTNRVMAELPDPQSEDLPVPHPVIPSGPPSQPPPDVKPQPAFGPGTLGIYPRSTWTTAKPNMSKIALIEGVRRITFHHSGDQHKGRNVPFLADGFRETISHLELVRRYHTQGKNWADIAYHFAIDRAGRVWQLRSLKYQGSHVSGANEHNVGIVVLGNFNVQEPTPAQKERIKSFGLLVRTQYALGINKIFTHQEIGKSDCPGRRLQPYMVAIRKQKLI